MRRRRSRSQPALSRAAASQLVQIPRRCSHLRTKPFGTTPRSRSPAAMRPQPERSPRGMAFAPTPWSAYSYNGPTEAVCRRPQSSCGLGRASPPISRVLSSASPAEAGTHRRGSHPSGSPVARRLKRPYPRTGRASRFVLLLGLAPSGVYLAGRSPGRWWALTTTISPSPVLPPAVSFLWHSPSGYPDRVLPGTLLCGARTFLDRCAPAAAAWRTREQILSASSRFQASRCSAGIKASVSQAENRVSPAPTMNASTRDRWTSCPEMADPTGKPA